jgi:hypothetical protein
MSAEAVEENAVMRYQKQWFQNQRGAIGYIGKEVPDAIKTDKSVSKQLLQIYIHSDYWHTGHTWVDLLNTLPALYEWNLMISTVNSHAAYVDFVTNTVPAFAEADAVAGYILEDQYTPTNGLPDCFGFLLNMSVSEKEEFFKSAWRTRSQHVDLVRILGVMNFIIVMGCTPLFATYATKFRVHTVLVDPISFKAVRYNVYDRRTWPAHIYDNYAPTQLGLTEEQVSLMYENVILQFNSFDLIIPAESVKMGHLLYGRFIIQEFKVNADVDYDVPVDFLFTMPQLDGTTPRPFTLLGDDWVADLALFTKVKDLIQNIGTFAQTVEYGDSYYGGTFPTWKDQLKYVSFDFDLLKEWTNMLPWPLLVIGSHHHPDPAGYPSAMFWAWNAANHGNDMTPDLGTNVAPNNQAYHMFTRVVPPQLAEGDDALQFFGLKLPGVSDEMYEIALIWMWFWLTPLMGIHLQTQIERTTLTDYHNISTYIEWFDTAGNLMFESLVDVSMNIGVDDAWFGWLGTTEHPHFREFYIPKSRLSLAWPNIQKDKTYLTIADDNEVGNLNAENFFEKVMRNVGYYNYSILKFGWKFTISIMDKFVNPIFHKPVPNNPLNKDLAKEGIANPKDPGKQPPTGVMQPPKGATGPQNAEKVLETTDVVGGKPPETYAKDQGKNGPQNPTEVKEVTGELKVDETPSPPSEKAEEDKDKST